MRLLIIVLCLDLACPLVLAECLMAARCPLAVLVLPDKDSITPQTEVLMGVLIEQGRVGRNDMMSGSKKRILNEADSIDFGGRDGYSLRWT